MKSVATRRQQRKRKLHPTYSMPTCSGSYLVEIAVEALQLQLHTRTNALTKRPETRCSLSTMSKIPSFFGPCRTVNCFASRSNAKRYPKRRWWFHPSVSWEKERIVKSTTNRFLKDQENPIDNYCLTGVDLTMTFHQNQISFVQLLRTEQTEKPGSPF